MRRPRSGLDAVESASEAERWLMQPAGAKASSSPTPGMISDPSLSAAGGDDDVNDLVGIIAPTVSLNLVVRGPDAEEEKAKPVDPLLARFGFEDDDEQQQDDGGSLRARISSDFSRAGG